MPFVTSGASASAAELIWCQRPGRRVNAISHATVKSTSSSPFEYPSNLAM